MIRTISLLLVGTALSASGLQEVDAAMKALSQAMLKSDAAALEQLYSERLMYSHSDGKLESKAEAVAAAAQGRRSEFEFSNVKTEIYGDIALVRCDLAVKSANQPGGIRMNVLHVWKKNGRRWQLVGRQSTRYGK